MQLEVGKIYEGTVTGITIFGAFVELEKGTTGMVHISEVANTYVNDINEHITQGQQVKVKVLSLGEGGKISLSIKKAQPAPERPERGDRKPFNGSRPQGGRPGGRPQGDNRQGDNRQGGNGGEKRPRRPMTERPAPVDFAKNPPPEFEVRTSSEDANFEDMMARFKATSEERISDLKHVTENKRRGSSRRK